MIPKGAISKTQTVRNEANDLFSTSMLERKKMTDGKAQTSRDLDVSRECSMWTLFGYRFELTVKYKIFWSIWKI